MQHITMVGLDARAGNHFDQSWVRHHTPPNARCDLIVEGPSVGGRFENKGVGGMEMLGTPHRPLAEIEATRGHHDLLLCVDAAGDKIVLVNIEREIALEGLRGVVHRTLLCVERQRGIALRAWMGRGLWAQSFTNRYVFS